MEIKHPGLLDNIIYGPSTNVVVGSPTSTYVGNCKARGNCIGPDFRPFEFNKRGEIIYPGAGPVLCQYHGLLVVKLKQLTLAELEYLIGANPASTNIHRARMIAMRCSNEYFKKNHRRIFGCE